MKNSNSKHKLKPKHQQYLRGISWYCAVKYVSADACPDASGYDSNSNVITFPSDVYFHGYLGSGPGFSNVRRALFPLATLIQPAFKFSLVTLKDILLPFFTRILHSQLFVSRLGNCEII